MHIYLVECVYILVKPSTMCSKGEVLEPECYSQIVNEDRENIETITGTISEINYADSNCDNAKITHSVVVMKLTMSMLPQRH